MDSGIVNPNDLELKEAVMTSELWMGKDRYFMNFNKAFRAGAINPKIK